MARTQAATFAADVTKQVITLATAVLTLTVTFMSSLVPDPSTATTVLMAVGWLTLFISVVAGMFCLLALAGQISDAEGSGEAGDPASIRDRFVRYPAIAEVSTFLVGLILISIAATLSLK
jgi:hypothetical protein